LSLLL
jgi:hypothetical protein